MNKNKKLFICCTPLQGLIAERIIVAEGLSKEDCIIFFYTSYDNSVYRAYFNRINELCSDGLFYLWKNNFPQYICDIKEFFGKYVFDSYYFASVDSIFVHFALSISSQPFNVFTFDDGTANLIQSGNYFKKKKFSFKRLIFFVMGNRFDNLRIRKISKKHYTIFPEYMCLSNNPKKVNIFNFSESSRCSSEKSCTVILGTVYSEIFRDKEHIAFVKQSIAHIIHRLSGKIFYMPHPRESNWSVTGVNQIQVDKIAEEVIFELLASYKFVNVISFGSTAQLNLASIPGINNIFFRNENEAEWLQDVRILERNISGKNKIEYIDI